MKKLLRYGLPALGALILAAVLLLPNRAYFTVSGRSKMSTKVTVEMQSLRLLPGESVPVAVRVANVGAQPLQGPDPVASPQWPKLRVTHEGKGQSQLFPPNAAVDGSSHEFTAPRPEMPGTLAAGQSAVRQMELLRWVKLFGTGRYSFTGEYAVGAGVPATSEPVAVEVVQAKRNFTTLFGAHSGSAPLRHALSSLTPIGGQRSVLLLTTFTFDLHESHLNLAYGKRVAEVEAEAEPFAAVTPNNDAYAAQWLAWIHKDQISVQYVEQGQAKGPARSHRLPAANLVLAGPGLLDLANTDGTKPGEAEFPLWHEPSHTLSAIRVLADGNIRPGNRWTFGEGKRVWSNAVSHADKSRYATVLLARQDKGAKAGKVAIELAVLGRSGAATLLGEVNGQFLAADESLNNRNETFGAVLVQQDSQYLLQTWARSSLGQGKLGSPIAVTLPAGTLLRRALVEVSEAGRVAGLLETSEGQWLVLNPAGKTAPLPDAVRQAGDAVGLFWLGDSKPFAILHSSQAGTLMKGLRLEF